MSSAVKEIILICDLEISLGRQIQHDSVWDLQYTKSTLITAFLLEYLSNISFMSFGHSTLAAEYQPNFSCWTYFLFLGLIFNLLYII